MTNGKFYVFLFLFYLLMFFNCEKNPTESKGKAPELITSEVTEIRGTSAICGGTITSDGGSTVTSRGVCWSTEQAPSILDDTTNDGTGSGSFISNLKELTPTTTYYVRAYATNSSGTGYGSTMTFTTSQIYAPTLNTVQVTNIMVTTAICGGTINSDGGSLIKTKGVCWSTGQTPTVSDDTTNNGAGDGSFISRIKDLTGGTMYYVRAYASNDAGTAYGNTVTFTTLIGGTVTDFDGNIYQTIKIGNQWWIAENLKVTHYRNGDAIPNVTGNSDWYNLMTGAYCYYENNVSNSETYGLLYNWYAVNDNRNLCPNGWHIPSDTEWQILIDYLGGAIYAGNKMKESDTTHWSSNSGATNESGFTSLPGGWRRNNGTFYSIFDYSLYWSATEYDSLNAWVRQLRDNTSYVLNNGYSKASGCSVRCVKD